MEAKLPLVAQTRIIVHLAATLSLALVSIFVVN